MKLIITIFTLLFSINAWAVTCYVFTDAVECRSQPPTRTFLATIPLEDAKGSEMSDFDIVGNQVTLNRGRKAARIAAEQTGREQAATRIEAALARLRAKAARDKDIEDLLIILGK